MDRDRFPVVVHVLLLREPAVGGRRSGTELFLLRRAGTGFMDGYYVLPGGHQQQGESVSQAARRECREETGVAPADLEALCVLPYRSREHQGVNFLFEGQGLASEPAIGEPDKSDAAGWFPLHALPAPLAPWLGTVLELRNGGDWYRELHWD